MLAKTATAEATGSVTTPAMSGFGSVAISNFSGGEPVWAVRPDDDRVLIASDETGQQMMRSTNGGEAWSPMADLTDLVTDHGRLRFITEGKSQVTTIAFDPYFTDRIAVGTIAAGLFLSIDGGASWDRLAGSEAIPNITTVAFARDGTVWIASGGRGLWTWQRIFHIPPPPIYYRPDPCIIFDPITGSVVGVDLVGEPERCLACTFVFVRGGEIESLAFDRRRGIVIGASEPRSLVISSRKNEPLLAVTFPEKGAKFEGCGACAGLAAKGTPVRGLVLENGKLRAVVAATDDAWKTVVAKVNADEQPPAVAVNPAMEIDGPRRAPGYYLADQGETITIRGSGFMPKSDTQKDIAVGILLNGRRIQTVMPDEKGAFTAKVVLTTGPDEGSIRCVQQIGQRRITAERTILIANDDKNEKR